MPRKKHKRKVPRKYPKLIMRCVEYIHKSRIGEIPKGIRGIYSLLDKRGDYYNVVYVGLSNKDIRYRLWAHARTKSQWSHFSIYEVWINISEEQIDELEGLIRQIYRKDKRANKYNVIKRFKLLRVITFKEDRLDIYRRISRSGLLTPTAILRNKPILVPKKKKKD